MTIKSSISLKEGLVIFVIVCAVVFGVVGTIFGISRGKITDIALEANRDLTTQITDLKSQQNNKLKSDEATQKANAEVGKALMEVNDNARHIKNHVMQQIAVVNKKYDGLGDSKTVQTLRELEIRKIKFGALWISYCYIQPEDPDCKE